MIGKPCLLVVLLVAASAAPGTLAGGAEIHTSDEHRARLAPGVTESLVEGPALIYLTHVRGADADVARGDLDARGFDHVTLPRIGVTQLVADRTDVETLRALDWVASVHAERNHDVLLDDATPMVNATSAWSDLGFRGSGVGVFVVDSGVDALHPDLNDRLVMSAMCAEQHSAAAILAPCNRVEDVPFNDWLGHGTHVMGILAGTGEGLGPYDPTHGLYVGIAPEADVVSWGMAHPGFPTRLILHGYEYALENQERFDIRVISNSWGWWEQPDPDDPINVATLEAYRAGMAVVFGAGNSYGDEWPFLNTYAQMPWALSIGATDKQGALWAYSSQGTNPLESGAVWDHPSLVAPGDVIMAAKARAGTLQAAHVQWQTSPESPPEEHTAFATHYQVATGTSMSAPMVAGVLALMFEANPDLSPAQAYDILVGTAVPLSEDRPYWQAGAGLVDAGQAVERALEAKGGLDAFLAGDQPYTDWEDPLGEPLRRFLIQEHPENLEVDALIEFLETEGILGGPQALEALDEVEKSTPVWSLSAVLVLMLAVMIPSKRRRGHR